MRADDSDLPVWRCLPRPMLCRGEHAVRAVGPDDVEPIRQWRNAQLDVLRQSEPLTAEAQAAYFAREIWPSLSQAQPPNILLTLWWRGERIGYGGLVHVRWAYARAEVSFLLSPPLAGTPAECEIHFPAFLALMRELAFVDLGLRRLTTETYATRPAHIAALENAGFTREGVLREHVRVGDHWVNAVIHGLLQGDG